MDDSRNIFRKIRICPVSWLDFMQKDWKEPGSEAAINILSGTTVNLPESEIYFRTFEYAMDVHMPASFMTAYNAVNGCPTAADEELLQGLLREENGFAGFVMTDWTTYDSVDVAAMVQAGNCWITPGSNDDTYTGQIKNVYDS